VTLVFDIDLNTLSEMFSRDLIKLLQEQ